MKIIILIYSIIIISASNLLPQWSNDPNNNLIIGYGLDPHICSDSAGGCYVTYDYDNLSYPRKLALERLDRYGFKPWGTMKQILGELPGQYKAQIIEDGEGGVIISYEDRQENPGWTARIRMQRVDSIGNFLWGQTGVKVTLDDINQGSQKVVNDGEGGAVVIWVNTLAEYKVNRISYNGERMWGDSGIVLGINGFYDPAILVRTTNYNYVASGERNTYKYFDENGNIFYTGSVIWLENIISDGLGGIIISSRGGQWPENWQLRAQRKDPLGNSLWQEPHIVVAESLYVNSRPSIRNNSSYFYFGWSGKRNGIDRIAQFQAVRLDGSKLFSDGSISISNHTPLSIAGIVPSDSNRIVFIWNDHPNLPDTTFTHLYDTLGNKLWNEYGVVVAHPAMAYQTYTTDGNGGFIIGGVINNFTVVAQQVSKYGKLGEIITSVTQEYQDIIPVETILYLNYPNPFNPITTIKYDIIKAQDVNVIVYDILGREVVTLVNEQQQPGSYEVKWDASIVSSGIYFYQLRTKDYVNTKKMILLK